MADQSIIALAHHCPHCHRGPLFAGFLKMHETCASCGLRYGRGEDGNMWGAMAMSYAISAAIALPLFFLLLFNKVPQVYAFAIPVVVLAVIAPINVRLSRLVWAHAVYHLHGGKRD